MHRARECRALVILVLTDASRDAEQNQTLAGNDAPAPAGSLGFLETGRRDLAEAVGPVVAAPGEYLHNRVFQMDLDTVTVELDLVDPALAVWHGIDRRGQRRLDEVRHRVLAKVRRDVADPQPAVGIAIISMRLALA